MSLQKTELVDEITISAEGSVFVRKIVTITENSAEISKSFSRTSYYPGQDLTGVDQKVVDYCNMAWTPEVIAAYQAKVAEQLAKQVQEPQQ